MSYPAISVTLLHMPLPPSPFTCHPDPPACPRITAHRPPSASGRLPGLWRAEGQVTGVIRDREVTRGRRQAAWRAEVTQGHTEVTKRSGRSPGAGGRQPGGLRSYRVTLRSSRGQGGHPGPAAGSLAGSSHKVRRIKYGKKKNGKETWTNATDRPFRAIERISNLTRFYSLWFIVYFVYYF